MTARAPQAQKLTFEEYLELEKREGLRFEFWDGWVWAMSGSSLLHNEIVGNIYVALHALARAKGCRVFSEDVKAKVGRSNAYLYPDIMVSCAPENHSHEVHHPCFILEVLSPNTAEQDRGAKLRAYTEIPNLERYVLVSQDVQRLEVYQRTSWNWNYFEITGQHPEDVLHIPCLGTTLTLEQIYDGLEVARAL